MEGDILSGLMRWQVSVWAIGALLGAVALMARGFANRLMREIDQRFERLESMAAEIRRIDAELTGLRAELPLHYIRREDHIRDMSAITIKLDRIHEMLLMIAKETRHG